jgi:hypothetical protein
LADILEWQWRWYNRTNVQPVCTIILVADMKEASKGIQAFLSPALSAEHYQLLAKWQQTWLLVALSARKGNFGRGLGSLVVNPEFSSRKPGKMNFLL